MRKNKQLQIGRLNPDFSAEKSRITTTMHCYIGVKHKIMGDAQSPCELF